MAVSRRQLRARHRRAAERADLDDRHRGLVERRLGDDRVADERKRRVVGHAVRAHRVVHRDERIAFLPRDHGPQRRRGLVPRGPVPLGDHGQLHLGREVLPRLHELGDAALEAVVEHEGRDQHLRARDHELHRHGLVGQDALLHQLQRAVRVRHRLRARLERHDALLAAADHALWRDPQRDVDHDRKRAASAEHRGEERVGRRQHAHLARRHDHGHARRALSEEPKPPREVAAQAAVHDVADRAHARARADWQRAVLHLDRLDELAEADTRANGHEHSLAVVRELDRLQVREVEDDRVAARVARRVGRLVAAAHARDRRRFRQRPDHRSDLVGRARTVDRARERRPRDRLARLRHDLVAADRPDAIGEPRCVRLYGLDLNGSTPSGWCPEAALSKDRVADDEPESSGRRGLQHGPAGDVRIASHFVVPLHRAILLRCDARYPRGTCL